MDNGTHCMQSLAKVSIFILLVFTMQFKGRSLYNLLKISLKEDPTIQTEPWQILDYRSLSEADLFKGLEKLKVSLTPETLLLYAESCDTPEELLECLWVDESDLIGQDKAYLLLFELWRRHIPEKQSLSIFCDELDHLILLYDEESLPDEELLQATLGDLEDILDQGVDQGAEPQEIFQSVMLYTAHDLEQFLYDYIIDLMESSNELYASELIDGMSPYVSERKWFDLLKARLFALSNSPETSIFISRVLEQAEEEPDLSFLMELAQFLISFEDPSFFLECIKLLLPLVKEEEDWIDLLKMIAVFYQTLDKEVMAEKIEKHLEERKKDPVHAVQKSSHFLKQFLAEFS